MLLLLLTMMMMTMMMMYIEPCYNVVIPVVQHASVSCLCRLFAQLTFVGSDRAEFHIMQFIKLPSTSEKISKSSSKNVKRDSILPLDLLKGTDSDVKCYLASCLRVVHVRSHLSLTIMSLMQCGNALVASVCLSVCLSVCNAVLLKALT